MKLLAISRAINKPIHVVQRSYPNVILIGGNEGEFENNPESVDGIWLTFHTRMYGLGEVSATRHYKRVCLSSYSITTH